MGDITVISFEYMLIAAGILGLAFSFWQLYNINKAKFENPKISEATATIKDGVMTYITTKYKFLILFAVSLGILLFFHGKSNVNSNGLIAASLMIGAISSAAAGYFSMQHASNSVEKVVNESQQSYSDAFRTIFSASTSIGIIGVSSIVLGLSVLMLAFRLLNFEFELATSLNVIAGFTLGATSVAMFARLGGGVFAKGAEMGEDEIVKSKTGIVKNSTYNPASAANETGQFVSNVGGISADIFESFTAAIVGSMLLGAGLISADVSKTSGLLLLPLIIASIGIFTSIAGSFLLRSSEVSTSRKAINIAEGFAAIVLSIGVYFAIRYILPVEWQVIKTTDTEIIITTYKGLGVFWSAFFGITASIGIGYITKYVTSKESKTVKSITGQSMKGASNNILAGMESGFISTGIPVAIIIAVALASYYFSGFYGVGIAAVGFLGNMGLHLAFNAFAPIADNTNSVAIKAGLDDVGIKQANDLKQTGIQSIAQGKILLAVAASLTSLALFSAFVQLTGITEVNAIKPLIIASLFVGALLPILLSSNVIASVRRLSKKIVKEVNRQFDEIPALNEANEILDKYNGDLTYATEGEKEIVYSAQDSADNEQCIEIATYATIWESLIPGIIAITIPVLTAYLGGAEILAAMLLGVITTGSFIAIYQANKGSALENTNYALEEGTVYNGELIGKDSTAYQASVIGDEVGKPLKDAVSPAMTVFMKVILITAIILIPLLLSKAQKKKALQLEGLSKVEQAEGIFNKKVDAYKL